MGRAGRYVAPPAGHPPALMSLPSCPHCLMPLGGAGELPYPPRAQRCPHCRLVIGVGRARAQANPRNDARSRGAAAGAVANAARRETREPLDPVLVQDALRGVADAVGCPVERLRMLDYQQAAEQDGELPTLGDVLATFSTWKQARVVTLHAGARDRRVATV